MENCHEIYFCSKKGKKIKAIKRRRKVVRQRRPGGYENQRRTARKVEDDDVLPFTPKQKQKYIKGKFFRSYKLWFMKINKIGLIRIDHNNYFI